MTKTSNTKRRNQTKNIMTRPETIAASGQAKEAHGLSVMSEEGDDEEQARDLHCEGGTDRCRGAPGEVQREVLWVQAAEGEQGKGAKERRVHEVVDARGRARARELGAVRPGTGQPEG